MDENTYDKWKSGTFALCILLAEADMDSKNRKGDSIRTMNRNTYLSHWEFGFNSRTYL